MTTGEGIMQNRRQIFAAGLAGALVAIRKAGAQTPATLPSHTNLPQMPSAATLPIVGSGNMFAVRRVYCVGRNYLAHIEELGHDRNEPPFFFQKQRDMVVPTDVPVIYPSLTHDYEHEIELVLAMKSGGQNIPVDQALDHVFGYAVGLDMTRRDLQAKAQQKRQPWEMGKSFDQSAPCSAITPVARSGHLKEGRIHLTVNDKTVTDGNLEDMIWNTAEIIAQLSTLYTIAAGDLIYTGTPKGVGKVGPGDVMLARIDGLSPLRTPVSAV
jgi:fumarylpyruvate hydrolase